MNRFAVVNYITSGSMFFLGGGLCYVLEEKKYTHIPIVFFFPSIYCGYNLYKNREKVIKNMKM